MRHEQLREENCAIARSSAVLGERWVWPILRQSFNGARRFEEFQRGIGLARNVLADKLNLLVSEGVLVRTSDPPEGAGRNIDSPPRDTPCSPFTSPSCSGATNGPVCRHPRSTCCTNRAGIEPPPAWCAGNVEPK